MLSEDIMDREPSWMRTATEDDLREFVKILDTNENHPRHGMLLKEFDKECSRRAGNYNDSLNGGNWI